MDMARILVIDDDETFSYVLKRACSRQGHEVMLSASACEAKEASAGMFDIVFLDISLPDGNGLSLLPLLLGSEGHPEVIVITGHDNRDWLEQALMAGAWDFIRKDDSLDTVFAALEQALLYHQNRCGAQLSSSGQRTTPLKRNRLVGSGAAIGRCLESVIQCADSDVCVLLSGETGTGKEVFARTIHENSGRQNGPFIVVDCAALPENLAESLLFGHVRGAFTGAITRENGLIPEADGGTLFLDEVGELPLSLQKVFLRVLQEKRVRPVGSTQETPCDFRLIAATNKNLEHMVEEESFRRDLFYRLQTVHIPLPPLRERQEDILPLAHHFCAHFSELYALPAKQLATGTATALQLYGWPGNVRELCGAMERSHRGAGFRHFSPTPAHRHPHPCRNAALSRAFRSKGRKGLLRFRKRPPLLCRVPRTGMAKGRRPLSGPDTRSGRGKHFGGVRGDRAFPLTALRLAQTPRPHALMS